MTKKAGVSKLVGFLTQAQQLAIADAEACSKKRKRFHNLGKRYQDCHGTASFVSYSASGKQPAANRLTWNSLAIESLKDNEDVMTSLHVLMNGIVSTNQSFQPAATVCIQEGALYLLKLSNGSLRPRRRQRQCGSSSCDNDSDAAALDTHAELSQDGACKKQSDARNLSMHKRAKGSLTAQGYAIGGSLANSISARLALAPRHSPPGSALTEAGREAGLSGAGAGNPGSSPLTDLAAGRTPYLTALTADSPLPTAIAVGRAPPNGAGADPPLLTPMTAGRAAPGGLCVHSPLLTAMTAGHAAIAAGLAAPSPAPPAPSPAPSPALAAGLAAPSSGAGAASPLPTALAVGRATPNGARADSPLLTPMTAGRAAPGGVGVDSPLLIAMTAGRTAPSGAGADSPLLTALAAGRTAPSGAGAASPLLTALAAGRAAPGGAGADSPLLTALAAGWCAVGNQPYTDMTLDTLGRHAKLALDRGNLAAMRAVYAAMYSRPNATTNKMFKALHEAISKARIG